MTLMSPDPVARLSAAEAVYKSRDVTALPALEKALASEADPRIKSAFTLARAAILLTSATAADADRLAAVDVIVAKGDQDALGLLQSLPADAAAPLRDAAAAGISKINDSLRLWNVVQNLWFGLSLASVLLLAAIGLAVTFGVMGVINMAHGEMVMLGAYTTFMVQQMLRSYFPGLFDYSLALALPLAFLVSGLVGMLIERVVIRPLYGRPLETLLATWGISLILIQTVRTLFGAQNVQVENPAFMSGGMEILSGVVLPWSRIVIIGFALFVLFGIWVLLNKTRLGLFVRGVTQNRQMAACVGVSTARVDTWAFGLGSGIAGLAGCALSQIGNVGPDLGQAYIVDSFMVVVLGGVGQLAGTVYAALGLGFANKLLEAWQGAVLAKIAVLVFIIVFIQKRPQGMFALKGRAVE